MPHGNLVHFLPGNGNSLEVLWVISYSVMGVGAMEQSGLHSAVITLSLQHYNGDCSRCLYMMTSHFPGDLSVPTESDLIVVR